MEGGSRINTFREKDGHISGHSELEVPVARLSKHFKTGLCVMVTVLRELTNGMQREVAH